MNRVKWMSKARETERRKPISQGQALEWLSKLIEETGEVGLALNEQTATDVIEELEHVKFIADCFQKAMERSVGLRG